MTQEEGQTLRQKSTELMARGHNCAQAVAGAFADRPGLATASALRVAASLGGGMKCASVCGAVSGALLVTGLRFGSADPADKTARDAAGYAAKEFLRAFTEKHGALTCRELLGIDISTEKGARSARDAKLFTTICPELVGDAAQILVEQGY